MLRLFGPLTIEGGGGASLGQRPTRGLIAYLALKRGAVTSDELLEALWPGQEPTATRSRLWKARRQAQAVVGEALERRQNGYYLDRRQLPCDADEVDRLRHGPPDHARLERALGLMGGEPLADLDYPWAAPERRRLKAIQAETVGQVAQARLEQGNGSGALETAERLIDLDPLNEHGWCLAMQAEALLGQRQAIIDRYEQLARELDERLGLRPASQTRDTYRRMLGQG
jgi:DNA-binding SARP family transcriptional activator